MLLDTALVSRIQFGFTISFHILFPAFSIGLAIFLAIMEGLWLKTKDHVYLTICKFWTKIFALTFGMGVVSGIVMEFQLGTNWSGFTRAVGSVLGPLFTYEVMTAFFIEAGFIGVMIFGWNKVSPRLHYIATLCVVAGTTLSAYWIMTANTWMQHPVGYLKAESVYKIASWVDVIFNPFVFSRFMHMMLASYICAGFVICSVSAFYLLKNQFTSFAKKCYSFVWWSLLLLIPLQIYFGDMTGVMVYEKQPLKTAAMEGLWNTEKGAPLLLFAIPDQKNQKNYFEIKIPHLAALLNTHQWDGQLTGLKSVAPSEQPKVFPVFFAFRIMVGVGVLMLFLTLIALYLRYKRRLFDYSLFLKASVLSAPLGFIALWAGWITAEMGRQPWVVYHLIKTLDAVSPVSIHDILISFALIFVVYGIIFGYFYFYFLHKTIHHGPEEIDKKTIHQPFQYMPASTEAK